MASSVDIGSEDSTELERPELSLLVAAKSFLASSDFVLLDLDDVLVDSAALSVVDVGSEDSVELDSELSLAEELSASLVDFDSEAVDVADDELSEDSEAEEVGSSLALDSVEDELGSAEEEDEGSSDADEEECLSSSLRARLVGMAERDA